MFAVQGRFLPLNATLVSNRHSTLHPRRTSVQNGQALFPALGAVKTSAQPPLAAFPLPERGSARRRLEQRVQASSSGFSSSSDDIKEEATGLRRIGWISFWSQLALSIVSGIVLFFTATTASQGGFPKLPVFFNLAGVVTGFISTFLAFGKTRVARRVLVDGEKYSKSKVAAGVLGSIRLNLIGMGATIVGLQSTVGGLVGKALTSSSAGAYNMQAASNAPAALDVFAVQASTNTILLHFIAILFSNWTLRLLNNDVKSPAPAT